MQRFPAPRGRGAAISPGNRFERAHLTVLGEHLDDEFRESPDGKQIPTRVLADRTRTIINKVDSPDLGFNWTINPYRGCEHGCIYCYARPTHETLGFSCGLDFETNIVAKVEAPKLLRRELGAKKWMGETIVMSGVTDAYQPIERKMRITRDCLEVMAEFAQPVSIITKNRLILRDLDFLSELHSHQAAAVAVSLTTLDNKLASAMEPRAASPRERLETVRELAQAGLPVAVMTAPIIPGLNDYEIPSLLEAAADAGAKSAGMILLRLPYQVKDLFLEWLGRTFPDRAAKVESLIREARDGELSDATFGKRFRGTGARAEQIQATFDLFHRRHGFSNERTPLSSAEFLRRKARRPGTQLDLFGSA